MFPDYSVPSITVKQLAEWMKTHSDLVLLDVREPFEIGSAQLKDPRVVYAPLSRLASAEKPALPTTAQNPQALMVVFCHHGIRSVQVVAWLRQMGWQNTYDLAGGLEAYAREIDPGVGFY